MSLVGPNWKILGSRPLSKDLAALLTLNQEKHSISVLYVTLLSLIK